jgi:hypothetical protein
MSGAGRIKGDGSDDFRLYEIKDANKSYTLKADDLIALMTYAAREMKEPVMVVQFQHGNLTAIINVVRTDALKYKESE